MAACNPICEGACPDGGCGLNILDDCGGCVDPPERPAGGEEVTPKGALMDFILHDPIAEPVRVALVAAVAEKKKAAEP